MAFVYLTNCIGSGNGQAISDMVEQSRDVTWETFKKHVPVAETRQCFPCYSYRGEKYNPDTGELTAPMHIKDDYSVSFSKSMYRKMPCYYITHSAIEYIFVEES